MIKVFECLDEKKMHPDLFKSHSNGHIKVYLLDYLYYYRLTQGAEMDVEIEPRF